MAEEKKGWTTKKVILTVLGVLVVIGAIGNMAREKPAPLPPSPPVTAPNGSSLPAPETARAAIPETPPEPAAPKTWQKVVEMLGSEDKISPPFTLTGAQARMRYRFDDKGTGFGVFSVAFIAEGKTSGMPEFMVTDSASDETRILKRPGSYSLKAGCANGAFVIIVEELR